MSIRTLYSVSRASRFAVISLAFLSIPGLAVADSPPILEDLVRITRFEQSDIQGMADSVLIRELDVPESSRQVAFAGLIRIASKGSSLAKTLATPGPEAIGDAKASGRFSDPATPSDVASLRFPDDDIEVLADCRVNDCKLKLSRQGIDALAAIDWSNEQAGEQFSGWFRTEALSHVDAYRKQGNAALIVYEDKSKPISLSKTIESMVSRFEGFEHNAPQFTSYLTAYPDGRRPSMTEALTWAIKDFGYRPTLAVDHVIVDTEPESEGVLALIASKTIYANHYLAGRIQMGALLDGQVALDTPGHFIVLVDRVDFDDSLNGFKRKLLGRGLQSDMEARMEMLRRLADGGG